MVLAPMASLFHHSRCCDRIHINQTKPPDQAGPRTRRTHSRAYDIAAPATSARDTACQSVGFAAAPCVIPAGRGTSTRWPVGRRRCSWRAGCWPLLPYYPGSPRSGWLLGVLGIFPESTGDGCCLMASAGRPALSGSLVHHCFIRTKL
jgi:hypothetical protein